jgi:hypothetical protein
MRSVEEYLRQAADFDRLAASSAQPGLQKKFADLANCYRMLAEERRRLIAEGVIKDEGGADQSGPPSP